MQEQSCPHPLLGYYNPQRTWDGIYAEMCQHIGGLCQVRGWSVSPANTTMKAGSAIHQETIKQQWLLVTVNPDCVWTDRWKALFFYSLLKPSISCLMSKNLEAGTNTAYKKLSLGCKTQNGWLVVCQTVIPKHASSKKKKKKSITLVQSRPLKYDPLVEDRQFIQLGTKVL